MRMRFNLQPAISELENSLYVLTTNEPINRKEKNFEQADLERDNAQSFKQAIKVLKSRKSTMGFMKNTK